MSDQYVPALRQRFPPSCLMTFVGSRGKSPARHYDGQWRGSDRSPLGHGGPFPSVVASVFSYDLDGYLGFGPA